MKRPRLGNRTRKNELLEGWDFEMSFSPLPPHRYGVCNNRPHAVSLSVFVFHCGYSLFTYALDTHAYQPRLRPGARSDGAGWRSEHHAALRWGQGRFAVPGRRDLHPGRRCHGGHHRSDGSGARSAVRPAHRRHEACGPRGPDHRAGGTVAVPVLFEADTARRLPGYASRHTLNQATGLGTFAGGIAARRDSGPAKKCPPRMGRRPPVASLRTGGRRRCRLEFDAD